jgi:hypothetical protein
MVDWNGCYTKVAMLRPGGCEDLVTVHYNHPKVWGGGWVQFLDDFGDLAVIVAYTIPPSYKL